MALSFFGGGEGRGGGGGVTPVGLRLQLRNHARIYRYEMYDIERIICDMSKVSFMKQ